MEPAPEPEPELELEPEPEPEAACRSRRRDELVVDDGTAKLVCSSSDAAR